MRSSRRRPSFLEKEALHRIKSKSSWTYPMKYPRISSDRGQLQQVFLNILNNAFAAVDDGGRSDPELRTG